MCCLHHETQQPRLTGQLVVREEDLEWRNGVVIIIIIKKYIKIFINNNNNNNKHILDITLSPNIVIAQCQWNFKSVYRNYNSLIPTSTKTCLHDCEFVTIITELIISRAHFTKLRCLYNCVSNLYFLTVVDIRKSKFKNCVKSWYSRFT